jgi:KUP system potassium uptake protein
MIIKTFNPYYAIKLIYNSPSAIVILGAVFLCTTGAEALYSDLGHCGIKNIRVSWIFVKAMLILNYLGQGAWLLSNYHEVFRGKNPFSDYAGMVYYSEIIATAAVIANDTCYRCITMFSKLCRSILA